jgi:hypothetical protein
MHPPEPVQKSKDYLPLYYLAISIAFYGYNPPRRRAEDKSKSNHMIHQVF